MPCTTFLHPAELNLKLPDPELQSLLEHVRLKTGKDWQVVPFTAKRKWFNEKQEILYGVYVYIGGVGPWQQINFYRDGCETRNTFLVPLEIVSAYFYGMYNVVNTEDLI